MNLQPWQFWGREENRFGKYTVQICSGVIGELVFPVVMTVCESLCGEDEF